MNIDISTKIEKMRNGEKIKCPKCDNGFISAIGNPKTTNVFRCDACQTGMTLTLPYNKTNQ